MRLGQNPAKFIDNVAQPQDITVALVTYIPFLSGYYRDSLDVLKTCLGSLWKNSDLAFDLLVFDNASCPEVRAYLSEVQQQNKIQYLVLSDRNVGKSGAWNIIFTAAPGEIIAYADSDIFFFPGWLSSLVADLQSFPQAGMLTGMPLRSPEEFSTSTLAFVQQHPEWKLERGKHLPWEDFWRHSRSLGKSENEARQNFNRGEDLCLVQQGKRYYVGAGHFQFIGYKRLLQSVLPLPSQRPMGQVRMLDVALNKQGYLRLSTSRWCVQHMGNTLEGLEYIPHHLQEIQPRKLNNFPSFWQFKPLRRLLVWLNNKTFQLLYRG